MRYSDLEQKLTENCNCGLAKIQEGYEKGCIDHYQRLSLANDLLAVQATQLLAHALNAIALEMARLTVAVVDKKV